MNKQEFDRLYVGEGLPVAVHCDTREKAKEFLKLADSFGYKWTDGISYLESTGWSYYEVDSAYVISSGQCLSLGYVNSNGYNVVEYPASTKYDIEDTITEEAPRYADDVLGTYMEHCRALNIETKVVSIHDGYEYSDSVGIDFNMRVISTGFEQYENVVYYETSKCYTLGDCIPDNFHNYVIKYIIKVDDTEAYLLRVKKQVKERLSFLEGKQ